MVNPQELSLAQVIAYRPQKPAVYGREPTVNDRLRTAFRCKSGRVLRPYFYSGFVIFML